MKHTLTFLALTLLPALATVSPLTGEDSASWPQFHGPNRDNRSAETGLLRCWTPGGPPLAWSSTGIGHGFSTVSIAAGRIYTAGNMEDQTVVTALDLEGRILWQTACGKAWTKPHGGTRGTPTIDGERLYYETPLGEVVCLSVRDGSKLWGLNIIERFESENITWGLAESLLIDGDRVICSPGGPKATLVALDKLTGQVVWTTPSIGELAGYSSPVLAGHGGLRLVVAMTSRSVIGVDAGTGRLLWRFAHVTYADENIIRPIVHGGVVFVSTLFDAGSVKLKINVTGDEIAVEEAWRSHDLDNQHGGVILLDGHLYGASRSKNDAKWICLDWKTGRMSYAERGVGKGSLTYADGMFYILNEKGVVALVRAVPDRHEVVSSFQLPPGGQGPTWAHPVVCGGRLYLRHGDRLFAYDVKEADRGPAAARLLPLHPQRRPGLD